MTETVPTQRDALVLPRYTLREATHYLHWIDTVDCRPRQGGSLSASEILATNGTPTHRELRISFESLVRLFEMGFSRQGHFYFAGVAHRDGANANGLTCDFAPAGADVYVAIRLYQPSPEEAEPENRWERWSGLDGDKVRAILYGRIDFDGSRPVRFYPLSREYSPLESPRIIAVDPRYGFGRPIFADTGVRIDGITGRFRAGESITELADDTGIPPAHIEEAIRFESSFRHKYVY